MRRSWITGLLLPALCSCGSGSKDGNLDSPTTTTATVGTTSATTTPQPDAGPVPDGSAVDLASQLTLADVAILFPLASSEAEADEGYLEASFTGARGVLFPAAVAPNLGATGGPGGQGNATTSAASSYASLRVVGMRIDPCFAALEPPASGEGCLNQMRLVFQSLSSTGSSATDAAAHVFYSLTRDELPAVARSLVALRLAQTDGDVFASLAPNTIMKRQGLTGAMSAGVRAIILAYAGASNLTRVTHFTVDRTGGDQWTFSGADVTNATAATSTAMIIPTVNGATTQTFHGNLTSVGAEKALDGTAQPATRSSDDLMPLASLSAAAALGATQRQADYDALLRVENPTMNSSDTIDCVSCHVAMPARKLVAEGIYGLSATGDASAFADPSSVPSTDMAATLDDTQVNLHAFSYAGTHAAISQRTVDEAAAVVAYLSGR